MIVFDEVHCISLWGHTFRTAYLDCDAFRKSQLLRSIPQLLLSATVTSAVIRDLATILLLPDGFCFLKGDMNHHGHFYSFKPFTSNDVDLAPIMQSAIDAKYAICEYSYSW
jgi:superfamily II DNA helicase RecQ